MIHGAVRRLKGRGDQLVTSTQNAAEFCNVSTRPASARGGFGLSISEANWRLCLIERLISVLTESPNSYTLGRDLVRTYSVQGVQVHDARLVALSQTHGVTHILTLNLPDFQRFQGSSPVPWTQVGMRRPGGC